MAQKVEILNLDINTSALISKMTETRAEIDKLKSAQKELTNSNQSTSDAFTKNAVEIGRLQSSYNTQKSVVTQLTTANDAFAKATDAITSAVAKENTSIASARENNTQLLALRNQLNTKTVEGQTALAGINAKLDQNNAYIKSNVSAYEQQKISIGEYKKGITDAFQAINPLNGGMAGLAARATEAGGAGNLLKESLGGATAGVWGMIKASLAFIATPIGAIVALIAGAFLILYEIFKNFKPLLNPILDAFAALGAVFEVLKTSIFQLVTGAKSLKETFSSLGSNMSNAATEAYKLAAANRSLIASQRTAELSTAKLTTEIQGLILKSKDLTKNETERAAAADKAIRKEEEKQAILLTNSNKAIAAKRLEIMEGKNFTDEEAKNFARGNNNYAQKIKNDKNLDQQKIDDLRKLEVDRQSILQAGQSVTEKLQNRSNKLVEVAEEKRLKAIEDGKKNSEKAAQDAEAETQKRITEHNKNIDAGITKSKEEIDLFIAQEATKKKSAEDALIYEKTLLDKRLALNKKQFDDKKISATAYAAEELKLNNEYTARKTAAEQVELDRIKSFEDKKTALQNQLDIDKATTQAEKDTLKLTQDLDKHLLELEDIKLKETEKAELKKLLLEQYNLDVARITDTGAATAAQKKADFDIKSLEYEKQKNDILIGLAQQLGSTLLGLLGDSLGGQLAAIAFDAIIQIAKIRIATAAAQQINLAAATAISIPTAGASIIAATATNAALGASSKLQQAGIIASAAISGGGAILKKVQKKADGGVIETLGNGVINNGANVVPLSNGDNTLAYVKQGEVILNQQQQALAGGSRFFKSLGVPGFNGGGVVGGNTNLGTLNGFKIDYDVLANKMAQANRMLPAPVVSVTDISYHQNRVAVIEAGANL